MNRKLVLPFKKSTIELSSFQAAHWQLLFPLFSDMGDNKFSLKNINKYLQPYFNNDSISKTSLLQALQYRSILLGVFEDQVCQQTTQMSIDIFNCLQWNKRNTQYAISLIQNVCQDELITYVVYEKMLVQIGIINKISNEDKRDKLPIWQKEAVFNSIKYC